MTKPRDSYHHGDLRNALIDAAMELAKQGGPEAVVLREAARHVGVSPTAAYRHFASHTDLMHVIKDRALSILTDAMEEQLATLAQTSGPLADAVAGMRAIGAGYVHFALENPGVFRTWCNHTPAHDASETGDERKYEHSRPFRVLTEALDELGRVGLLKPERREGAEIAAWAAVHGLAILLLDGPLTSLPAEQKDAVINSTLDMVVGGICNQPPA